MEGAEHDWRRGDDKKMREVTLKKNENVTEGNEIK